MATPSGDTRSVLADVYDFLRAIAERESRRDESTSENQHEDEQADEAA